MKKRIKSLITVLLVAAMLLPNFAMVLPVSSAAASTSVPVELAFNNIFVFENWATNSLSSTLIKDGTPISGNKASEGGTMSIDIANGKITMTKTDMSIDELYTAFSNSATNGAMNAGYYEVKVKANTKYKFSFNLSGTTTAFAPYVFFYDSENKCISHSSATITETGKQSFEFTTPANTTHLQVRFTVSDRANTRPGVSSVTATIDTLKIAEVVAVQSDNLFRFDTWADSLSGKIATGNATMTTDKVNNTFTITRTSGTAEIYNTFSMSPDPAGNAGLYAIDVEPDKEYSLVYTTYNTTEAALDTFFPLIFVFDEDNKYIDGQMIQGTCNANIDKNEGSVDRSYTFRYDFTVPSNAGKVQIRFTFQDPTASTTVSVKNIVFCESNLISDNNLFNYDEWKNTVSSANGGISALHNNGTLATNATDKSIAITTKPNPASVTLTYVDFGTIESGYAIPVEPGKTYTITYNLDFGSCVGISAFTQVRIFTAWYNSAKNFTGYANYFPANIANKGENTHTFTVPAGTYYIELAFANYYPVEGSKVVLNNVEMYETDISSYGLYEETGEKPEDIHRKAYTYTGNGETYGTLPVPNEIPNKQVFAGWYTGENGTGDYISANTPIHYDSLTVYSKFEPAVDSLSVATMPTRVVYTKGEKFNPAGLVLNATMDGSSFTVASGYRCSPEYLTTVGDNVPVTVEYGGKSVTVYVKVVASNDSTISVNSAPLDVTVTNNKYTLNYTAPSAFNRYEITYYSDSYVRGLITFENNKTEEFFLEPSDNGTFASLIDGFLNSASYSKVVSIEFRCLDKEYGTIELYTLSTINQTVPTEHVQYFENDKYKVGIDLAFGGVVSYIEAKEASEQGKGNVMAATYADKNGKIYTKVDYKDMLPQGAISTVESVNLINTNDKGRYLQQSYYGTDQPPFVMGDYNGTAWKYNPVQGGNLDSLITQNGGEASKVIDFRITHNQIYVKTRPLDWGKNSTDYANDPAWNTPSYMEAWYTFSTGENTAAGLIQGTCRFVDYSGYAAATTDQEFPAFYTVEPLNHFVYNNVTEENAWKANQEQFKNDDYLRNLSDTKTLGNGAINLEEPEFWGVNPNYAQYAPNKDELDPDVECYENWAAFTASEDKNSFGIGVYSPGVTDFHYGCFLPKYMESQYNAQGEYANTEDGEYIKAQKAGTLSSYTHIANYRHAETLDPATEMHTSYIAPVSKLHFQSYTPITYTYYVSTGTADEIREDFRVAKETEENADKEATKIAVPETVYLNPSNNKDGQYYVNNILNDYNVIETVAESNDKLYVALYARDAKQFTVKVTNATDPSNDVEFYNLSSGANVEGQTVAYPSGGSYRADETYGLRLKTTALNPGEMATAKWEITITLNDNTTQTYTAYTVLFAPERTVGAVAEARKSGNDNNETGNWITGATSMVTDSNGSHILTPIGGNVYIGDEGSSSSGYFKQDPLVYPEKMTTESTDKTSNDHINVTTAGTAYVMQTSVGNNDHSRAKSYLGLLTIDQSRYSNTNQIPNLRIGFDVLHVHSGRNDALKDYKTAYTLGTESSWNPSGSGDSNIQSYPSGWSTDGLVGNGRIQNWKDSPYATPYRQTVVPNYTVSDSMDGQYLHAVSQGLANYLGDRTYGTSVTSVMIKVTDKSELRDAVMDGYGVTNGTPLFNEKLQNAATVLGDPTATQEEIDKAKKELSDAQKYALKYDNLFSTLEFSQHSGNQNVVGGGTVSYENNTIIIKNGTITNGETYTEYSGRDEFYKIDLKPNTEYVFEYDVTTTVESQAFLFFYNSSNSASEPATNIQVKTNNGSWVAKTEASAHIGNYQQSAGTAHYAIKFTTGATTTQVGFRFGNKSNSPTTSTFSNIRLIDSEHYYEGATYEKTEASYAKNASYGSLIIPTRPGYTFLRWVDANGNTVSGSGIATNHQTVYSVWSAITYTIKYNSKGGSGYIADQTVAYDQLVTLASGGFTKSGYALSGWSTNSSATTVEYSLGQSVSKLTTTNGGTVTLYAVWVMSKINVTFDNLIDFNAWNKTTASNGVISNVTDTGFTLTSNDGAGEGTSSSPYFTVEPGKNYMIDIDITDLNNKGWDVYIFFCDANGNWVDFGDGETNRYSASTTWDHIFTAPNKDSVVKAQIRVDANSSNGSVNFNNIRVYEYDGVSTIEVTPVNKFVQSGSAYGTLPTPTKEGYTFVGWYDGNTKVTEETIVTATSTVFLKSRWKIADTALVMDKVVLDFVSPIDIKPLNNDTILTKDSGTKKVVGLSATDTASTATSYTGTYGTFSLNTSNNTITYTPNASKGTLNAVETLYYHVSHTAADGTVTSVKSKIVVAPASNVLYEETYLNTGITGSAAWETVKTSALGGLSVTSKQDSSTDNDLYGYDSSYNKIQAYSGGSALKVTVTNEKKTSTFLTFDFKGKGFDLIGDCGADTGVLIVSIKNKASGSMVKSYIVDTYYGDTFGTLNQVPLISERGLDYGTYTVQIASSYLSLSGALKASQKAEAQSVGDVTANVVSAYDDPILREALAEVGLEYVLDAESVDVIWFDENSTFAGGMGANTPVEGQFETAALTSLVNVIDCVRVYSPLTTDDGNLYYVETEMNPQYINVMDNLLDPAGGLGLTDGFFSYVYISREDNQELTVDRYKTIGPKDELYLAKSTEAIAFTIKNFDKTSGGRVMISLRAAKGDSIKVKIGSNEITVTSNTEMYYDITDYIGEGGTITIQNTTAGTLLSVGTIKFTSPAMFLASVSSDFDTAVVMAMMRAPVQEDEPEVPVEPEEPIVPDEPDNNEDPTEDPADEPTDSEEPATDDEGGCPFIWLLRWIVDMFRKLFSAFMDLFGF